MNCDEFPTDILSVNHPQINNLTTMKFSYRVVFSLEQLLTLDEEEALRFTCQKLNLGNTQLSGVKKIRTRTGPGIGLGLGPDVLVKR